MSTRRFVAAFLFVMASVLLGALPAQAQFQLRLEQAGFSSKTVTDNGPGDTDPAMGRITYNGAYGNFTVTVNTGVSKPVIGNGTTQADMDLNSSEFTTSTGGTLQITLVDTGFSFPNNNSGNQMTLTSNVGGSFGGIVGAPPAGTSVTFRAWANPTNASPLSVDPSVIPPGSVGVVPMGPFTVSPYSGNAAPVNFTKGAGPYSIFNQATIFLPGPGRVGFDHFTRVEGQNCTGKLGNYVWNDLNHNGIQESGEPGIPGITVTLMKNGNPSATTTTDASGLYQFTGLCAASYTVEVPPQAGLTGYVASPTLQGGDFGTDSNPNPTTVSFATDNEDDQTIDFGYYIPAPHLTLQKSPKGGTFNQGDPISFSFVVGNDGGSPALNVHLTDQLPGNGGLVWQVGTVSQGSCGVASNLLSCNLGTIQPSGTVNVTVTSVGGTPLAACQAQPNPLATATADGGLSATDSGSLNCVPPQLSIVKTPDGGTFAVGAAVTFTIVVSNPAPAGASPASNVMLTDTLPNNGGLVWNSATASQGSCALNSNNLSCALGTIAAGASVTVTVSSTATTPASACQLQSNPVARATADGGLDVQDSGSVDCIQPASLGDFVWHDLDADGVQDAGEPGIPGVTVTLLKCNGTPTGMTTTTNASGFYSFPNLTPDCYKVQFAPPAGFTASPANQGANDAADSDSVGGLTGNYILAPGDNNLTVDAGFYKPAGLGDFVWNDLNVNGVQNAGEPGIPGVTVVLLLCNGSPTGMTTTTNAAGFYQFTNLTPGCYKVQFATPANFTPTAANQGANDAADSDAVGGVTGNYTLNSGDNNLTVDAGFYSLPPGLTLVKSANVQITGPYQPVIYTYTVTNTGGTTLTNIVVTDDNGTPNFAGDDFTVGVIASLAPGASATLTATVIPVVSTVGVVNGNSVPAGAVIVVVPQANGDIKVTYLQSFGINDNTYGTGAIGWPSGHTFGNLTGSDKLEFRFFDRNGNMVLDLYQDYISATSLAPSGYASLCASGGDGSLVSGSLANIVSCTTSLADNLNNPLNLPNKAALIVNSPTSLVGGNVVIDPVKAPGGWNHINSYTVVVKASTFGSAGFGSVAVPDQHNSPNKLAGPNGMATTPTPSTVVNTAKATANGGLTATATASVSIIPGSLGPASVSGFVYYDANNNGIKEPGEIGLGTTLSLTGTDDNGTPITRTTSSDGITGAYSFTNLPPGNYKITETQPASYLQGKNSVGTVSGVLDGVLVPVDMIDSIDLDSGDAGINFNFGEILASTPNLTLVKSANQQTIGPYQPVTYTYTVTNTGGSTVTNIVVTDDNGTPNFAGDDITIGVIASLAPGASATLTAQIIPVVSTVGVVNGNNVPAGAVIVVVPQGNGDIKVTYLQSFGINDNTYGTGAIGWPNGHKFGDLTGSDKLEFRFFDKNGNVVLDLYQDYISATANLAQYPSGYASLCASGGDGSLVFGNLANIVGCTTSLADSLNNPLNLPNKAALIVNSPTSLVGGNVVIDQVKAPGGWNHINSYTVVVKASTFGSAGFGSVVVPDQHNSPNKLAGPNGMATTPTNSTVVNTATATASSGLSASATASVAIVVPPSGGGACSAVITLLKLDKKDFQVTIKNNGASDIFLTGFALTWPTLNGKLMQLKLDGDVVYDNPDIPAPSANLTSAQLVGDQNKRKVGHGSSDTLHILFEHNVDKTTANYADGLLTFGAGCTVTFP